MENPAEAAPLRRVIKRYSNRKLYDTRESRYITLLQVADLVRAGEDVQILDNASKEDKTEATLALIIAEELKARPRSIPLSTLKALISHRGERLLTSLRDGAIGKFKREDELSEHERTGERDRAADTEQTTDLVSQTTAPARSGQSATSSAPTDLEHLRNQLEQTRLELRSLNQRVRELETQMLKDQGIADSARS